MKFPCGRQLLTSLTDGKWATGRGKGERGGMGRGEEGRRRRGDFHRYMMGCLGGHKL